MKHRWLRIKKDQVAHLIRSHEENCYTTFCGKDIREPFGLYFTVNKLARCAACQWRGGLKK